MNYYRILGVGISATPAEIRTAFRRISLETHPDRHPDDPEKAARFREASEAYTVLSDEELREKYDRMANPPETVADLLLGSEAGRKAIDLYLPKAPAEPASGEDILIKKYLPSEALRQGTSITLHHQDEELVLTVPPTDAPMIIARIAGLGRPGRQGGTNGNLLVAVVARDSR